MTEVSVHGKSLSWLSQQYWFDPAWFCDAFVASQHLYVPIPGPDWKDQPGRVDMRIYVREPVGDRYLSFWIILHEWASVTDVERTIAELARGEPASTDYRIEYFQYTESLTDERQPTSPDREVDVVRSDIDIEGMREVQVEGQTLSWLSQQEWFDRQAFTKPWIDRPFASQLGTDWKDTPQRIRMTFHRITDYDLCISLTLNEHATPNEVERTLVQLVAGEDPDADFTIKSFRPWLFQRPNERTNEVLLHDDEITEEALAALWARCDITVLYLCGPNATDDVLPGLIQNPIEQMHLNRGAVTDRGIAFLAEFHTLRELQLNGTPITDAALDSLAMLPDLRLLSMRDTQITDAGAMKLASFPRLNRIVLPYTVSNECYRELQRLLPRCRITR